jgi:hypothetical protein
MSPDRWSRIFLLSHMRAFTSLVGHILGSHPAINGYFELHIDYDEPSALDKQIDELRRHEALKANSRYLFDKLLHNDYRLEPTSLEPERMKILVSLREPEPCIKSVVNLFAQKEATESYERPEEAARYYIERVRWLDRFCRSAGSDYYYFDADTVLHKPASVLAALTRWLELDTPLRERYRTFSQTGRPRKGDSSALIRSGRILGSPSDYSHIPLSPDLVEAALSAYRPCRQNMIDHAADCVLH